MLSVIVIITILLLTNTPVSSSSEDIGGFATGYLSDCPGSTNPAVLTPASLKKLSIIVQSPGDLFHHKRAKYNYYQMEGLAKDPLLDFKKKTFFYVPGYLDGSNLPKGFALSKYYADLGYNALILDNLYFTTIDYPISARFMRQIGFHVAEMLSNLTSYGLNPKKLELLGLSIGGQAMSFIAKNYRQLTGIKISRLTGLDPAGPCYRNLGPDLRLDKSDADFVDVVATNIDGYGMARPVGHVNFYVNGGEYQLGDIIWYYCDQYCSHLRSFLIWVAVVQNPKKALFIGMKCNSVQQARERGCYDNEPRITNVLGPYVNKTNHGIFYVATNNLFPFYMGIKGLKKENDFYLSHLIAFNNETISKV